MQLELMVLACVTLVLVLVIFNDLRRMRIPNVLTYVLLALFPLHALGFPEWHSVFVQLGFAIVVFALGFAAFAARAMGGGDVKIAAALALFAPLDHLAEILVIFSASIFLAVVLVVGSRKLVESPSGDWVFLTSRKFPLGLPIGASGLVVALAGFMQAV